MKPYRPLQRFNATMKIFLSPSQNYESEQPILPDSPWTLPLKKQWSVSKSDDFLLRSLIIDERGWTLFVPSGYTHSTTPFPNCRPLFSCSRRCRGLDPTGTSI